MRSCIDPLPDGHQYCDPFKNIPAELKSRPQWVGYELKQKTNPDPARPWKQDKIPVNLRTGGNAAVDNPATWAPYEAAVAALEAGDVRGRLIHGIGYTFWKGDPTGRLHIAPDPYVGIDLDDCLDPETEEVAPWAQAVIDRANSYAEISPSGRGVKIICRGTLPGPGGQRGDLEIYDRGRFFALTGDHLLGTPFTVEERTTQLAEIYRQYFPTRKKTHAKSTARAQRHDAADLTRAQDALRHIAAADYDVWLRMGMAVHSLDPGEAGFTVWETWSRTCPEKFDAEVCHEKWESFSADRTDAVTVGTLFALAKEGGWTPPSNGRGAHTAEAPPKTDWSDTEAASDSRTTERGSFNLTDLGNGERLIARHGGDLRYCTPWAKWLVWDGKRWSVDATQEVRQRARETVRAIYTEASSAVGEKERREIAQHAIRSEAGARVDAMVSLAQMDCPVLPEALDTDTWALNVLNGTIDLRTGALRPHRREDLLTKLVPLAGQVP